MRALSDLQNVALRVSAGTRPRLPQARSRRSRGGLQTESSTCKHCGSPLLDARAVDSGFCCNGCSYVYRLVHDQGLEGYYNVKDPITSPADPAVFHPRDTSWLEELQREAEARSSHSSHQPDSSHPPELTLSVQGISCAGCVWLIERVFRQQPGARSIVVSPHHGTMRLRWAPGEFSAAAFARKLQSLGYLTGPAGATGAEPESRALVRRIGLCAAFAMNVMLYALPAYFGMNAEFEYAQLFGILTALFGTLSFLVGGTYFLGRAVGALREGAMHIDLPIAIGILGAFAGSIYGWLAGIEQLVYFDFLSAFILLMLIGRWAQVAAVERNRRRLLNQQPTPRRVKLADGTEVAPEKLQTGQSFHLGSGQTLPVESRLESAEAQFSLASINGESEPRLFRGGQRVPAGAVNAGRDAQMLTALQGWSESLLARLLETRVREGGRHRLLENIVKGYLVGILAIATLAGAWWWFTTVDAVLTWSVVTAVLVVSCPCAIGLAFPLADEMATVGLRRRGVFVLDGDLWSRLGRVRTLVFDKTGTLTLETPVLLNPEAMDSLTPEARHVLQTLVRDNPHPVSQCLLEHLLASGSASEGGSESESGRLSFADELRPLSLSPSLSLAERAVHETIGQGVELGPWTLGRPGWRTTPQSTYHSIGDTPPEVGPDQCHLLGDISSVAAGGDVARQGLERGHPTTYKSGAASLPEAARRDHQCHLIGDISPGVTEPVLARGGDEQCHLLGDIGPGAAGTVLARDGEVIANFRFADAARPDARVELAALARRGFDAFILSGDRTEKVAALASELGLPAAHAVGDMSPDGKAAWIEANARNALMLGDGANDSLAFESALCRGTPVIHRGMLEGKSDFYYLGRGIGGVRALLETDAARRATQIAILAFSILYNATAVGLAVAGVMNPLVAAVLMPINSLLTLAIVGIGMRRSITG
ncbi:MAG TPA: heavy metal translocating P-type ATPase metal-binding domain-containing protein [Opitutaceae bacterium]|nr:heavy metal translocating P-type ATPase metal-binding domain-containing protein [Opitutaceae bacterium]